MWPTRLARPSSRRYSGLAGAEGWGCPLVPSGIQEGRRNGSGWCPNSTERGSSPMRSAVYNAAIPNMVNRALRFAPGFRLALQILSLIFAFVIELQAADWSGP